MCVTIDANVPVPSVLARCGLGYVCANLPLSLTDGECKNEMIRMEYNDFISVLVSVFVRALFHS